jgi:ankyrin repeat protein
MERADFIQAVIQGDESEALEALRQNPALARARNEQGVSIVCLAVYRGLRELAAALAALRDDLDIFEASCAGELERVIAIVTEDPQAVNAVSPDGFGPAGYSAFFGHVALLKELIGRGADVSAPAQNAMRVCPLHSAAAHADPVKALELARIVLEAGGPPNSVQEGGFTALHAAAQRGHVALIELLLKHGADPELETAQGQKAVDLARSKGHEAAVRRLESRS